MQFMGFIQTNPTMDRVVPKVTVDNTAIRPVTKLFNVMVSKYVFMLLRFRVELQILYIKCTTAYKRFGPRLVERHFTVGGWF